MKLYELTEAYLNILSLMDSEELDKQDLEKALSNINEEIENKSDNIGKVLQTLDADIQALKNEEKRLATRRKSLEKNKESLKEYLSNSLKIQDVKKLKTNLFTFYFKKNPTSVSIKDGVEIPKEYLIEQEPKVDKRAIKKDLEDGKVIDGVELTQSESMVIR